ncbi:MAG: hypothetical protein ACLP00_06915, partial [Terracidiphilus sp.]
MIKNLSGLAENSKSGSVLIWVLIFGLIFGALYARRLHPFQPPIDKASVQVLKVLGLVSLHAVQKLNISCDNEYLPPPLQLTKIDHALSRKWKRAVSLAFPGDKSKVAIDLELPYRVNIGNEFKFDLFDRYQVLGFVLNFKLNRDLAGIFESTWNVYTQRNNVHPLAQSGRLKRNLFLGGFGGLAGFPSLPNDSAQREHQQPCGYSFGPCQEFVPPWRAGLALLCILAGLYCARQGSRSSGWLAGLFALYVVAFAAFVVVLVVSGHQYYCGGQDGHTSQAYPFQHDGETVSQKYMDSSSVWMGRWGDMSKGGYDKLLRKYEECTAENLRLQKEVIASKHAISEIERAPAKQEEQKSEANALRKKFASL